MRQYRQCLHANLIRRAQERIIFFQQVERLLSCSMVDTVFFQFARLIAFFKLGCEICRFKMIFWHAKVGEPNWHGSSALPRLFSEPAENYFCFGNCSSGINITNGFKRSYTWSCGLLAICVRPALVKILFCPSSGTTSANVPNAARSNALSILYFFPVIPDRS